MRLSTKEGEGMTDRPSSQAGIAGSQAVPAGSQVKACIICALKAEARPFLQGMGQRKLVTGGRHKYYRGYLQGALTALYVSGAGRDKAFRATQAAIAEVRPACVILSGTAGGIDQRLAVGDTVVATELVFHDISDAGLLDRYPGLSGTVFVSDAGLLKLLRDALLLQPAKQAVLFGRMATGDVFVKKNNRASIIERFNPLSADMEAAAVAVACSLQNVPFVAVKSITDTAENASTLTFLRNLRLASVNSYQIVKAILADV